VGHVELDVVLGQDQGVAFGADLGALAGDRAVGGEDGQVLASHEGAGARFAGGVGLRAVRPIGAHLQVDHRERGRCAFHGAFGLGEFLADEAAGLGVFSAGLVGILEGRHGVDREAYAEAGRLALGGQLALRGVLRCSQVDVLADQGQVFLGGDVGGDHLQRFARFELDAAVQGANAGGCFAASASCEALAVARSRLSDFEVLQWIRFLRLR